MPLGEARRFANRSQFTTGAAFGIQNHGLQSLGDTISTIAFRVVTQRPCGSPVNGGRHRVNRRRPSFGLRQSCAPRRRCQSCVRRHRRRSYARPRCSSVRTFAAQIGNAALEPNTAVLEPSIAAPEPSIAVLEPSIAAPERNIAAPQPNTAAPEPGCVAKTEPNSGLGKAITYLLRHWKALTTFLREAGAR